MHAWINLSHPGFSGRTDMPDDGDEWISWEEMARIVREHNERQAREEQETSFDVQGPPFPKTILDQLCVDLIAGRATIESGCIDEEQVAILVNWTKGFALAGTLPNLKEDEFSASAAETILKAFPEMAVPMDPGFVAARKKALGPVPDYTGEGSAWVPPTKPKRMADPASFGFGTYMDPLVAEAVRASDCSLAKPRTPTWPLPGSSPSLAALSDQSGCRQGSPDRLPFACLHLDRDGEAPGA